ncbi:MAG: DUF2065 domain-containing protein [Proteobacteria bacterium SW_6_67_9]|jgi:uncharacterized protein YjeT (DUF2065 family)|nr:MAG: DUF2065 domain-containing protein [Proteobacteria bacterium SW_6_67_9]
MTLEWNDLLAALALVLVIEGIMPFLAPASVRRTMAHMSDLPDRQLRTGALVSMLLGIGVLYLVR